MLVAHTENQSGGSDIPRLANGIACTVLVLAKHVEGSRVDHLRMVG